MEYSNCISIVTWRCFASSAQATLFRPFTYTYLTSGKQKQLTKSKNSSGKSKEALRIIITIIIR